MFTEIAQVPARAFNAADDPYIGALSSGGTGQQHRGQLGIIVSVTHSIAAQLSDPDVGTLYGGLYQYVQFLEGASQAPARGRIAYWSDPDNYVIDTDATTAESEIAGIVLNPVTKGNYGWIQRAGLASVLFGTITKTTPALGDLVIGATGVADILADATGLSSVEARKILGKAEAVAADDTISRVFLTSPILNL